MGETVSLPVITAEPMPSSFIPNCWRVTYPNGSCALTSMGRVCDLGTREQADRVLLWALAQWIEKKWGMQGD